jgi:hypothetical protein
MFTRFIPALLRALAAGALPALLTTAAPTALANQPGWTTCAQEGQTCRVNGRAMVRYGVPGNWATRSVSGSVLCSNLAFGDPAPNSPKRCEVAGGGGFGGSGGSGGGFGGSGGSGSGDWVFCAPEGQICRFRGATEVRFGDGNRFTTRRAYNSVRCDVADFGDPAYGVTKHCEVRRSALEGGGSGGSGGSWAGGSTDWRYCAAENQTCRVNGRAQVRFGDGQRYATRTVSGDIACSVGSFGDPAYGQVKHCEVQRAGWESSNVWTDCAREGRRCSFEGRAQVRYGIDGRYVYRDAWGGVNCDSNSFGGDPFPNRPKRCEIKK